MLHKTKIRPAPAAWLSGILSGFFLSTALAAGQPAPAPEQPVATPVTQTAQAQTRQQARTYKTLTLDNGLAVFLTHDAEADQSAAALSVGAGSLHDPAEKQGLAHYLEHMLFLGTEKYPAVGEYGQFIGAHGGSNNAFTASDETNYHFGINHNAFAEALDRFSDFFKAPLFDEQYAAREVNAVNSEFDKNIQHDGNRIHFLKGQTAVPGHPVSNFSTGNRDTLAGDNRAALRAFFDRYYAASNMKLAIISNLPLEAQERLVRERFSAIRNFEVQHPAINPDFRPPLTDKYRLLQVKTVKDILALHLDFPTIRLGDYPDSKPNAILASVIGDEGAGSLLSQLKEEGLAVSLSAGGDSDHPAINSMSISIGLTPQGMAKYETIMERVFSYLQMLKMEGIREYTFEETKAMNKIHLDWISPEEGTGYVVKQASLMHSYPLEKLQTQPYLIEKFDPESYRKILDTMTPGNMLVTLAGQNVATDSISAYYGTEYSLREVGGEAFNRLLDPPAIASNIHYPAANDFIPRNLSLIDESTVSTADIQAPQPIMDNELGKVWFQFDRLFHQPKAFISLHLKMPRAYDTVDNSVKATLLEMCIDESLNEQAYPIQSAGLAYTLESTREGFVLQFGGYKDRIPDLIRLVSSHITDCHLDEETFETLKDLTARRWKTSEKQNALARASSNLRTAMTEKLYKTSENIDVLSRITLEDVREYGRTIFNQVKVTGLAYGNWQPSDATNAVNILLQHTQSQPLPDAMPEIKITPLNTGERTPIAVRGTDNNNAVIYAVNGGSTTPKNLAAIQLIEQAISNDFYTKLRTEQQLGYIVQAFSQNFVNTLFLNFAVQSADYSPVEAQSRIEQWMSGAIHIVENLNDDDFENLKQSIAQSYESTADSMASLHGELFYLVREKDADFSYYNNMAATSRNLTKQDIIDLARTLLAGPQTSRVIVHVHKEGSQEPIPTDAYKSADEFKRAQKANVPQGQIIPSAPKPPALTN